MVVVKKPRFLRCAITVLGGLTTPESRMTRLREEVRRWAADGIHFVQIREKELEAGELLKLAEAAETVIRELFTAENGPPRPQTKLLINGRVDIAVAAGAQGTHLTARPGELTPAQVRYLFASVGSAGCTVSVSCHSLGEVLAGKDAGADLILFGPVFEKRIGHRMVQPGLGLDSLREACDAAGSLPVLALGGVTLENARECVGVGAAGIAGIRLFS